MNQFFLACMWAINNNKKIEIHFETACLFILQLRFCISNTYKNEFFFLYVNATLSINL
jgi:hypothetical protein